MKKLLSILFAMLLLCMSVIPSYAANYAISVKAPYTAAVGDTISVSVILSSNSGLGALDFTVKFNTSEFELVSGSAKASELLVAETQVGTGSIRYAGMTAGTVSSSGSALMTFKLKVLKTGGKITLSVNDAIDGNDNDITSSFLTAGATVKCSHANMNWTVTKKATCTQKGEKKGTCTCGYTTTETIMKIDHTYGNFTVTKEPTCTEKGEKTAVCSQCKTKVTETVSAKGHTYGKWTIEKEPTKTEKGLKWAECSICGNKKEQAIAVIGETETTETTTSVEETTESTTEEQTTAPTVDIVEKTSTSKIVATTIFTVLGIEAIIGAIIFFVIKKKKENK